MLPSPRWLLGDLARSAPVLRSGLLFGWWWPDPVGALLMLPMILWQGWETLAEDENTVKRSPLKSEWA
jgi:divalent metal cation (Fe/Co/Zn/Cd) transporter